MKIKTKTTFMAGNQIPVESTQDFNIDFNSFNELNKINFAPKKINYLDITINDNYTEYHLFNKKFEMLTLYLKNNSLSANLF